MSQDYLRKELERCIGEALPGYGEPTYLCPFCPSRGFASDRGHVHVNYSKGVALCHRCGYGTQNLTSMIFQVTGKVPNLLLAEARANGFLNTVKLILSEKKKDKEEKEPPCKLPRQFIPLTYPPKKMFAMRCVEYLEGRGVDQQTVENLNIGYAIKGQYAGMIIFPIYMGDELKFFTSRRVISSPGPKTLHSGIKRASLMFNINEAFKARRVIVDEGPFDALSWPRKCGVGVATMGHSLSVEQARLLLSMKDVEEYIICYDADARKSTLEAASLLDSMCLDDRVVSVILLEKGDPNSEREHLMEYFRNRVTFSKSLLIKMSIGGNQCFAPN